MKKIELFGRTVNGELRINRRQLAIELEQFGNHSVRFVIEPLNKRSSQQNRYLHLLFTIFQKELNETTGNQFTMEEIKDLCKCKFLTTDVVNEETAEVIGQRIRGTSELTKTEMMAFVEQVIAWAADMFHITLPYPNEQMEIQYTAHLDHSTNAIIIEGEN